MAAVLGLVTGVGYTFRLRRKYALPDHLRSAVLTTGGTAFTPGARSDVLADAAIYLGEYENTIGVEDTDVDVKWRKVWEDASAGRQWEITTTVRAD